MLTRYWQWTTADADAATSGLPFGPLRFRAWTSPSGSAPAGAGLPFGPLRFRAWTIGTFEPTIPPTTSGGGGYSTRKPPIDDRLARALQREDELFLIVIASAFASDIAG